MSQPQPPQPGLSGVTVNTHHGTDARKVSESLPGPLGAANKTAHDATKTMGKPDAQGSDVGMLVSDAGSFVASCADTATGIATDPIGWLIGQGLSFLISVVEPLQDLLHQVSGDGPALAQAAGNFDSIAQGLEQYAQRFQQGVDAQMKFAWDGRAAEAAEAKLGEFAAGIQGVAGECGNIAKMLQTSSMIMTVVEEFIKALITELITQLILIWVPALAASVVTVGASDAAAAGVTVAKVAQVVGKVMQKVKHLLRLFKQIGAFLRQVMQQIGRIKGMRALASKAGDATRPAATALKSKADDAVGKFKNDGGMLGSRGDTGERKEKFEESMTRTAFGQFGLGRGKFDESGTWKLNDSTGDRIGTAADSAGKAGKYAGQEAQADGYDERGAEQGQEEAKRNLEL